MAKSKSVMEHKRENEEEGGVVRHFESLMDEGDYFMHVQKFNKSIVCYSRALELQPNDEHCLIARSRCYLFNGAIENALKDAECSLVTNPKNPKGIFQKAEVLYFKGEFEKALVLYHRGHKARPEMGNFRLGIQKCEEAIINCVGNPDLIKLNLNCDLSYFFMNENQNKKPKKQSGIIMKIKSTQEKEEKTKRRPCNTNLKTVKQLLGELYTDREYLEKLLNDEESMDKKTQNSEEIRDLTVKGLNFLDDRSDFWQQEKPMYARKKYHIYKSSRNSSASSKQQTNIIKYVITTLEEIDTKQLKSEHKKAIKQSCYLLNQINKWSDKELPNRFDIQANVYCLVGNSYLEMGDYDKALEFHEKDNSFGKKHQLEEAISRSTDNLGRVYAKKGQFQKAIEIWNEKTNITKSPLESTWLFHEIGRCFFELENYDKAVEYGERSIEFAREAEDDTWQMNSSILVAQANIKCKKFSQAIEHFERALEYSKILQNRAASEAIKNAIEDSNKKIIEINREHTKSEEIPKIEILEKSKNEVGNKENLIKKEQLFISNETKIKTKDKCDDLKNNEEVISKGNDESHIQDKTLKNNDTPLTIDIEVKENLPLFDNSLSPVAESFEEYQ